MTTMKYLYAIALILTASAAQAQTPRPYPLPPRATPDRGALPPVEYDKPYKGKLTMVRGDRFLMDKLCPKSSFTPTLGCAYSSVDLSECVVIMAIDGLIYDAGWSPEVVWRHERGHCLGWPVDHPGARPVTAETIGQR